MNGFNLKAKVPCSQVLMPRLSCLAVRPFLCSCRDEEKVHFGQAGLLALPSWVSAPVLAQWVQEARDFAAEWAELRPLHQNKLAGRCLRSPLQVMAFSCVHRHASP